MFKHSIMEAFMKKGFTLAEVLITLGVIGVVAAMTMPTLIQNHKRHEVETKLKKFYSTINQAIKLSEAENGTCNEWDLDMLNHNDTNGAYGDEFFEKYLSKYLQVSEKGDYPITSSRIAKYVRFSDGSIMIYDASRGLDIQYLPKFVDKDNRKDGRTSFAFTFAKIDTIGAKCSIEPFTARWDGTDEDLMNNKNFGCAVSGSYCIKLIQQNGWKIPKDYPWKF